MVPRLKHQTARNITCYGCYEPSKEKQFDVIKTSTNKQPNIMQKLRKYLNTVNLGGIE
jgi:hypothetical protein